MRVAALYDIHGNQPALEAVLKEVRAADVDLVVVGGDVLPGPMPRMCVALLEALEIPTAFLMGNGDRTALEILGGKDGGASSDESRRSVLAWSGGELLPEQQQSVADWPATRRIRIVGLGEVLFCHATPRSDTEIFTRLTPEEQLRPAFGKLRDVAVVVCGHTHMQFDRRVGDLRIVNAGSVGMPFAAPGAYWVMLGPGVQFRHTQYDLAAAAALVRHSGYPQAEAFAEKSILNPPSEESMLSELMAAGKA